MDTLTIERAFASYLEKSSVSSDVKSFALTYIQLLLLFKSSLSSEVESGLRERRRQLSGQSFDMSSIEKLRITSRAALNRAIKDNVESTGEAMLNRLVFCALLDTGETDSFYLTEPMFEFVRMMQVSPIELITILEEEFVGFRMRG